MVAPCAPSPEVSSPAAGVPNVFIEVLILEVPAKPPRDLRSASIQELLREPDVGVLMTPHILATPGVRAEIRLDAPGSMPFRFTVKPDLGEGDRIALDLDLGFDLQGETVQIRRVIDVTAGKPSVLTEARTPVAEGRGVTAIVVAHVLRRPDDLRRVAACRGMPMPPPVPPQGPPRASSRC
ncbi:hypothetical protein WMF30_18545 [Sorangium sp. So ce134]